MWLCPLPTGEALRKLAERCGISSAVEASDHEIQRRIREVQRYNREQWLFWASMAAPFVAVGSLWAVIHNGQQQAENARAQAENARQQGEKLVNAQRDLVNAQHELLMAQLGLELVKHFDSREMRHARRRFARELLKGKDVQEERVLNFFATVALFLRRGRLDQDTVYTSFFYWIERYWLASRHVVLDWRKVYGDDQLYGGFEALNEEMIKLDASPVRMSPAALKRFLLDEANLPD